MKNTFCLLLLVALCYSQNTKPTFYVDSMTGSDSNSGTSPSYPFATIQAAASAATESSTIFLFGGRYNGTKNVDIRFEVDIEIGLYNATADTQSAVINCNVNGAISDGFQTERELRVDTLEFEECETAIGANNADSTVEIIHCKFSDTHNIGIDIGAASSVSLDSSSFYRSAVSSIRISGAQEIKLSGLHFEDGGGCDFSNFVDLDISNCDGRNITSDSDRAPAFRINGGSVVADTLTFEDCEASENDQLSAGSILYLENAEVSIKQCKFFDSRAAQQGGAVYAANCTLNIDGTEFSNNTAGDEGGALFAKDSRIILTDSKFEGNIADMGGAIAVSGTSDLQIDSAYFDSNEASTGSCISCCPQETTCSTNVSEGDITYDGNVNTSSTGTNVDCQNISYSPPSI